MTCSKCGEDKPETAFELRSDTKKRRGVCATCRGSRQRAHWREQGIDPTQVPPKPGACPVCARTGPLVVDHDHATGRVRGWLCAQCNNALGLAQDSPKILRALARYLEQGVSRAHR